MATLPRARTISVALALAVLAAALSACNQDKPPRAAHAPIIGEGRPHVSHPVLEGTVGGIAAFADSAGVFVEGYGIVSALPNTGSSDMPPPIRDLLKEQLYSRGAGTASLGTEKFNPEKILSSPTIAAVEVRGRIPALARKGTTFDLTINALPGTQTTSLEKGLLLSADLSTIGLREDNLTTHTIAVGEGPVYCKPDLDPSKPLKRNLRTATVIGGGYLREDQPIRLQLYSPSYMRTQQIQRAVNSRWVDRFKPIASATGDSIVDLRVPPEFEDNPRAFIDLVTHLYLAQEIPGFAPRKAKELVVALEDPKAPHGEISLALQGLGRSILDDTLRPSYLSPNESVRFHTARAGAMMLDVSAMVVLQEIAKNHASKYQLDAINAVAEAARLGETTSATAALMSLIDASDTQTRLAAYRGLINMHSPAVNSGIVGRNFFLDYVPSKGPPIIYATQSGHRRIALIGKPMFLQPGVLYVSRDNLLTVNAVETPGDDAVPVIAPSSPVVKSASPDRKDAVQLYYRNPTSGKAVTLKAPNSLAAVIARLGYMPNPRAKDLNPEMPFIGASYQQLIEMLAGMTKDQSIPAEFVLEKAADPILTPADILAAARPEKSVAAPTTATAPSTQPDAPATEPAFDMGALLDPPAPK